MRSKFLLFYVFVLFISQVVLVPQAYAFLRMEQLVKDTVDAELVTYAQAKFQRLSCDDITGDIERVVVSMSHQQVAPEHHPYSNYTLEFQGAINQTSEILHVTDTDGRQHEYVFMFSPPVNGANLCAGQSSVLMSIKSGMSAYLGRGKLYGSNFPEAYRDANFDCGFSCAIRDWYFIINPQPPVITLRGSSSLVLEEGDVYVEQHAIATDLEDGNISASIIVGGDFVNTNLAGTYYVTYNVTDSHGIASQEVTRTVVVDAASQILEPLDLQVDSQTNPPQVGTSTPSFSAAFYSPTSTILAVAYEIQIATSSNNWVYPYFDSGMQQLSSSTPSGMRSPQILGPTSPQDGRSYFWRIRFWDQDGNKGKWSTGSNYYLIAIPPSPDIHLLAVQDVLTQSFFSNKYVEPRDNSVQQTIFCSVVDGYVTGIALFGRGNGLPQTARVYLTDNAGHTSDIQEFSGTTTAVTAANWFSGFKRYVFSFPNPIQCNEGLLSFQIRILDAQSIILDGAINEVFPWGECLGVYCVQVKDLYFEIFGTSTVTQAVNHAPVLDLIGNRTVNEGELIEFTVNATDADNDTLTYSASNLPPGASFSTITRVFSWTPDFNQSGNYPDIEFTVMDDGEPMMIATQFVAISVDNVNRQPLLDLIGDKVGTEGVSIAFTVHAVDPDGDTLTYEASNLPPGATFTTSTGVFSWTPGYSQAGNYTDIEFAVMDNGTPMELDTELIMISVGNVNRPPVFGSVGTQAALEGETISFVVSSTDPDGDSVVLFASGTPAGASFDANTGLFSWTPTLAQSGAYIVQFIATDNGTPNLATLLEVPLTIGDNPTPTEQAEAVVDVVVDYNFPLNVENSYLANLKKVAKFIEEGKIAAARNQLLAFIDKVENDMTAGVIGQTEGNELLALANALLDDLQ